MENDSQEQIVVNKDYFELDYPGQKYTKSIKFKDWKKEYKSSHQGRLGKQYLCKKDNIIFYWDTEKFYRPRCPKCRENICKFCRSGSGYNCCFMSKVELFCLNGPYIFIQNIDNKRESLVIIFLFELIPYINILTIVMPFFRFLNEFYKNDEILCKTIDKDYFFSTILIITLVLPYFIIYHCLYILFIIFSIPSKFEPLIDYLQSARG